MNQAAIQTDQLTRTFGNIRAVDNLTLTVPQGIVFGLLGLDGSGKTTTIRMLLGLLDATSGRARVLGYDPATESHRIGAETGVLMQPDDLDPGLTATDNLERRGSLYLMPRHERQTRIRALLTTMNLWEYRDERVGDLSPCMRRKLALMCAVIRRPRLVFLDEPTAGLDPVAAAALRDDLAGLVAREGMTVLLTTPNLFEAEKLCRRIGVIHAGKLVADGETAMLRRQQTPSIEITGHNFNEGILASLRAYPQVQSVERVHAVEREHLRVNLNHSGDTTALLQAIMHAGGQIEHVGRTPANLEDILTMLLGKGAGTMET
jgi:ABC-2 type transport system ATP-binding protein